MCVCVKENDGLCERRRIGDLCGFFIIQLDSIIGYASWDCVSYRFCLCVSDHPYHFNLQLDQLLFFFSIPLFFLFFHIYHFDRFSCVIVLSMKIWF